MSPFFGKGKRLLLCITIEKTQEAFFTIEIGGCWIAQIM